MTSNLDTNRTGRSRFVALDRDGTITTERRRPITDPADLELLPGAADGLRRMTDMGLGLFIITNQSGVGRRTLAKEQLDLVHSHLTRMLDQQGVAIQGIYACVHTPGQGCSCRKPLTGLLEQAAHELAFSPNDCFLVGDKLSDLDCGRRFGATTVLVRTGYGAEMESESAGAADYVADDLNEAARTIERIIYAETTAETKSAAEGVFGEAQG